MLFAVVSLATFTFTWRLPVEVDCSALLSRCDVFATCICMERGVTSSCVGAVAYAHRWVLFPDVQRRICGGLPLQGLGN